MSKKYLLKTFWSMEELNEFIESEEEKNVHLKINVVNIQMIISLLTYYLFYTVDYID